MQGSQNLEDVLQIGVSAALAAIDTCLVCTVVSYDATQQTADLRPVTTRRVPNPEGGTVEETLPDIPAVRVLHPGGANWAVHVPLKAGDGVAVLCSKTDFSEWLRTGNRSAPADHRTFSLAFAIAIPGLRRTPISDANSADITFVHSSGFKVVLNSAGYMEVGGSVDAAALASKVADLASALASHTHLFTGTGSVGAVNPVFTPAASYGSTKLKVGG